MRHRPPLPAALRAVPLAIVVMTVVLAATGNWPFDARRAASGGAGSAASLLLADRVTLGSVRLSVVVLAVFAVGSVVALALAGRWLHAFGNGIQTEPLRENHLELRDRLRARGAEVATLRRQRDAYRAGWLRALELLAAEPAADPQQED